jgi:hypothetical protein
MEDILINPPLLDRLPNPTAPRQPTLVVDSDSSNGKYSLYPVKDKGSESAKRREESPSPTERVRDIQERPHIPELQDRSFLPGLQRDYISFY